MPSRSKAQQKMIFARRKQYGSKEKTPDKWKWIWEKGWEKLETGAPEKITEEADGIKPFNYYLQKVTGYTEGRYIKYGVKRRFKKGDFVTFHFSGEEAGELPIGDWGVDEEEYKKIKAHDGRVAKIISIAIDDAPKDENPHYLNIEFVDGFNIDAVSNDHLEMVTKKTKKG